MTATVLAAQVSKNFEANQDTAVRDPVIINMKNGRPRAVLTAVKEIVEARLPNSKPSGCLGLAGVRLMQHLPMRPLRY